MIQFKENAQTDGKMEGQKDRQTLFYRTLPANAGGPINFFIVQQINYLNLGQKIGSK